MEEVPPVWRLHHVGVAVPDVVTATEPYVAGLGMVPLGDILRDEIQRVDLRFLGVPGTPPDSGLDAGIALELVAPYDEASPVAGHLLRGIGAYHTCYEVPDLGPALGRLRAARFRVLAEPVPAAAFGGRPIAWVLAPSRHLVELLGA